MKILIGYDGSDTADAALAELARAGLPDQTHAEVLSVHEHWLQPPSSQQAYQSTLQEMGTLAMAQKACEQLRAKFPTWHLHAHADMGSPAKILLDRAAAEHPDLIVIGSHNQTALGRLLLGSVSQKVLTEARCSVRIARKNYQPENAPTRILIGADGSIGAQTALEAVAHRTWKTGSEIRLVFCTYPVPAVTADQIIVPMVDWIAAERDRMEKELQRLVTNLQAQGLSASSVVLSGYPKSTLLAEAEAWQADCIFVGATSMNTMDRFLLGSVSAAVAARAHCSVEVVRQ